MMSEESERFENKMEESGVGALVRMTIGIHGLLKEKIGLEMADKTFDLIKNRAHEFKEHEDAINRSLSRIAASFKNLLIAALGEERATNLLLFMITDLKEEVKKELQKEKEKNEGRN